MLILNITLTAATALLHYTYSETKKIWTLTANALIVTNNTGDWRSNCDAIGIVDDLQCRD